MQDTTPEFFKLDAIDKQVLFWIMDNKPEDLNAWARFIAMNYGLKGIRINPDDLVEEIRNEMEGTVS